MAASANFGDDGVQDLLRSLAPQVLGIMVRRYRDFAVCEDAVQEALIAAAEQWPKDSVPDNPRAWMVRVAVRRLTDAVRSESARRHCETLTISLVPADEQIALAADAEGSGGERDDTLELLFMCCHSSLSTASAIALTLRAVGGLTTAEIAKAFLVPEATMAQRISRAKRTIDAAGRQFEMPTDEALAARLVAVNHVLYLIFSEGYAASTASQIIRTDLSGEAIRLARMLHRLVPEDPEVTGLLALMLLTDARRASRTGPDGEIVPLDHQDRSRWDHVAIVEGVALISDTLPRQRIGPYQIQAAIAAIHDEAPSAEETDWPQIFALYEVLGALSDNPVVALNQAVAAAMVHGPAAGLRQLDTLAADIRMANHHRLHAVRGHLLERSGDPAGAVACYRRAAAGTTSMAERNYLLLQAARLDDALSK